VILLRKTGIVHGTLLLTAANLAIRFVSMMFQIYLSGRLGPAGLGLMQLILSVSILAMTLGSSGIRIAAMYLIAEEHSRHRSGGIRTAVSFCMTAGLVISTLAGLALTGSAGYLAEHWLMDVRAASSLRLLGLFLPVTCLTSVMTGYFTACGKIRQVVAIELAERIVCVPVTIFFLTHWAGNDLERSCCAIFGGSAITNTISLFIMYGIYLADRRQFAPLQEEIHMGRRLFRLCVPLAVNDYLRSGLSTLENLLIPHGLRQYGESGEQAMATYGVIHGMVFPVITFAAAILYSLADILVPELAGCKASGNRERIRHLTDLCLRYGFVFAAAVAGLLGSLAEPLGQLLYQNTEAGRYIAVLAPMVLILYLDTIVDGMHKGLGQQLYCVRYNTLTSFLDVLFLFLLLPRWGVNGFLFSFVLTHLLNFYLSIRRLVVITGYSLHIPFSLRAGVFALTAVFPIRFLYYGTAPDAAAAILLGLCYLLLYALMLFLTNTFSRSDQLWMYSKILYKRN